MIVHNFEFTSGLCMYIPFNLQLQCIPNANRYSITVSTFKRVNNRLHIDEKYNYIKNDTSIMYPDTFPPSLIHDIICIIMALPMYEFINRTRISEIVANVVRNHI